LSFNWAWISQRPLAQRNAQMGTANPQALSEAQEEVVAGKPTTYSDPKINEFIRKHGPMLGFQSQALYRAALAEFPNLNVTLMAFRQHALNIKISRITIPDADTPVVEDFTLKVPWKTVLVTADYQIPNHDEQFIKFAFELGHAWGVEGHVINADLFDMGTISKFPQQILGERVPLGEEFKLGKQIIELSQELHHKVAFNTGNHEWRLIRKMLNAELDATQVRDLLANKETLYTPLSYIWLGYDEEPVRITHPKSQSVIAGAVGADIARNFDCHVIVAHDHLVAQRRSHSGRWTVTHSGMMANPSKLMYAITADDRRPRMNQGFVIVHPDHKTGQPRIRLIDAKNCDQELEMWIAERKGAHNNGMEKRRKNLRP
jgi:hypothetical protein